MLSYRHAFHAGNYADLIKHTALVHCLEYLVEKAAPLRYLDTHAGIGAYSLSTPEAAKTGEYARGVGLLWQQPHLPHALARWHHWVASFNGGTGLSAYPGSPWLAQQILRPQDRLELCEWHPQDIQTLRRQMAGDPRVHCHHENGYARALALMPPIEKRALVLIDPSYEVKDEYQQVVDSLKALHRRFATGVYLLWYPVVDDRYLQRLLRGLVQSGIKKIQRYELSLGPDASGMRASGLIAINPPYTLKQAMQESLLFAQALIAPEGHVTVEDLVGE